MPTSAGLAGEGDLQENRNSSDNHIVAEICARVERCPRMLVPGGARAWPDKKLVELGNVRDLADSLHNAGEQSIRGFGTRDLGSVEALKRSVELVSCPTNSSSILRHLGSI